MTPVDAEKPLPLTSEAGKPKKRRSTLLGLFMVVMMLATAIAVIAIWHMVKNNEEMPKPSFQSIVQAPVVDKVNDAQMQATEQRLTAIETRVSDVVSRLDKLEQAKPVETEAMAVKPAPDADVGKLKDDVATLTLGLADVQTQLRQAAQIADKSRTADQQAMAAVVAFTQLRNVAETGEAFQPEYNALYQASSHDAALQETVGMLASVAPTGAPSLPLLREEFTGLRHTAETAVKRSEARGWKDRIMVELQALVSVRPLYPAATGESGLEGIQGDLAAHRFAAVSEKINALPAAAQETLKDWKLRFEARVKLDDSLKAVANALANQRPDISAAPATPVAAP